MLDSSYIQELKALVPPFLFAPILFVLWLFSFWLLKRFIFFRLKLWARHTKTQWDDIMIDALSFPLNVLIFASGLVVLENLMPFPPKADHAATMILQGCVIFSIVMFIDRLAVVLIQQYASKSFFNQISPGLAKGIVRGFVVVLGALIFLDLIGISVTPILASLGIGSLAVALALQDTLSNFFAGVYVAVDKPVQEGDFVKLENGDEGYVIDVGWRSTRLKTRSENVVVIPNSKLIGSTITNYYLPTKEMNATVSIGVHYSSDLEKVERVSLEIARELIKTFPGAVSDFEPVVRYSAFADSSINFVVVMRVKEVSEAGVLQHEYIKKAHERFKKEGIEIPYPMRTLELSAGTTAEIKNFLKK